MKQVDYKIPFISRMSVSQAKKATEDAEQRRFMKKVQKSPSDGLLIENYRKRQKKIQREIFG